MLKRLYISNFALIGEMNVDFAEGLTVITGETGAGKSIFLEAMSMALGSRADLSALRDKKNKCVVEAEFEIDNDAIKQIFDQNEIDFDSKIILRRELSPEGRSRSLLNDSLVNLNVLKQISEKVIDIHSQHETLLLNESDFQMELLDAFANAGKKFEKYLSEYKALLQIKNKLSVLLDNESNAKKDFDYFSFLLNEFESFEIHSGQLEALEAQSMSIENAENIKRNLLEASHLINGGEENVLSALIRARQNAQSISKFNTGYAEFYNRINAVYLELKDLCGEMDHAETLVGFDKAKLEEINASMDKLNRLMNKHQVKTEEELIAIRADLEQKIAGLQSLESEITECKKLLDKKEALCWDLAKDLSKTRKAATALIESKTKTMLSSLSMPNAEFKIDLSENKALGNNGIDAVRFLFSANKGSSLSELHKVASGGELSRLMLTLKSLLASKKKLPSIIFDEIDTGVSGDVANKIGNILFQMGKNMQVIAITHLPQLASKGNQHLYVYKKDDDEKTKSLIKHIEGDERVKEIAKMLSAGKLTETALINAKELLASYE